MKSLPLNLNWPVYVMFYSFYNGTSNQKICYDFFRNQIKDYKSYNEKLIHYNDDGKDDYLNWCKDPINKVAKEIAHSKIGRSSEYVKQFGNASNIKGEFIYQNGEDFAVNIIDGKVCWQDMNAIEFDTLKLFYPTVSTAMNRFSRARKNEFDFIPKKTSKERPTLRPLYPEKIQDIEIEKLESIFGTNYEIVRAFEYTANNDDPKFVLHPIKLSFPYFNGERLSLNVCVKTWQDN